MARPPWLGCRGGREVEVMARLNRKTFRFGHQDCTAVYGTNRLFDVHFPAAPFGSSVKDDGLIAEHGGVVGTAVHQRTSRTPC